MAKNVEGFEPLTQGENAEPITFPGPEGQTVVVSANARVISPAVVSSNGNATCLPPNGDCILDGTESTSTLALSGQKAGPRQGSRI